MKHESHLKEIALHLVLIAGLPLGVLSVVPVFCEHFGYQVQMLDTLLFAAKFLVLCNIVRHPIPKELDSESAHLGFHDLFPGAAKYSKGKEALQNKKADE